MFQLKVGFWVGFFFPLFLFTDNNLRPASGIFIYKSTSFMKNQVMVSWFIPATSSVHG